MNFKGEVQKWDRGRSSIKLNYDFRIKTTIRINALYLFFKNVYVYLSKMYTETAEIILKKKTVNFVCGRRTFL